MIDPLAVRSVVLVSVYLRVSSATVVSSPVLGVRPTQYPLLI